MKLDLLKKLTALANNNPNENEANLAARKVCLMLAEAKFALPIEVSKTSARSQNPWGFSGGVSEQKEPKTASQTWNDVKRSEEPQFSSSREPNFRSASTPYGSNPFWDIFEKMYGAKYKTSWNSGAKRDYDIPKQEPSQTKEDSFRDYVIWDDFDPSTIDDILGKKKPNDNPKGFKESDFRNYNPIDDSIEASCVVCKHFFRISKTSFEAFKSCYVCDSCGGKYK